MKKHTYLAGISLDEIDSEDGLDDEELEDIVGRIYRFVDFAVYEFDTPPKIYLIANKNKDYKDFLSNPEDNSLIEIYQGDDSGENDEVPTKDEIKNLITKHLNGLEIFDGWSCMIWLAFEYPEEDPDKPGGLWLNEFEGIVGEFDAIRIIGDLILIPSSLEVGAGLFETTSIFLLFSEIPFEAFETLILLSPS